MDPCRRTDNELVQDYLGGNLQAMSVLAERYGKRLAGFLFKQVGNHHDALDIAQEVWRRVLHTVANYDPEASSFFTWLIWQARSELTGFLRGRATHRTISLNELLDSWENNAPHTAAAEQGLVNGEEGETIQTLLTQISPKCRAVLELRYLAGLSVVQTAVHLGIPVGTVGSRQSEGVRQLRELLRVRGV
jgi:RNA polymerase sigma-70 factor (ECF subfamily)